MGNEYRGTTVPDGDDSEEDLLRKIASSLAGSVNLPRWNSRTFAYQGSTNNVTTIVYKLDGVTVATQRFTYVAAGVADDDDVASETITY